MDEVPVIGGGICKHPKERFFRKCFTFLSDHGNKIMMLEQRSNAACDVIDGDTLFVCGGKDKYKIHTTSEFVSLNGISVEGPEFPFPIHSHTVINFDASAIYIIGGYQSGDWSEKTWILNPSKKFELSEGPSLNIARCCHASGKMICNGKVLLVVAGGFFENSVEILDPTSDQGWKFGNFFSILQEFLIKQIPISNF